MKALHWAKVPDMELDKTFWAKGVDDEGIRKKFDLTDLEETFKVKSAGTPSSKTDSVDLDKKKEKKEISVLDGKRSYNIAIMLSRLRMSFPEIRKAILVIDDTLLTEQLLKNFLEYIPALEEVEALAIYMQGDAAKNLGLAEQFFIEMLRIERYEQRLRALYFKRRFQERMDEIVPGVNSLYLACQETKASGKLKTVFEIVLALGNYLNGGTARGAAYGFRASFLLKLGDTKAIDGKSTLLHYLHKILVKSFPGTQDLKSEMMHVEGASKVNLTTILSEISDLRNGVRMIQEEIPFHDDSKPGDFFASVMRSFVDKAVKAVDSTEQKISLMVQSMLAFPCPFFFFFA